MIFCENFLPCEGGGSNFYPITISPTEDTKYNFTKVHPGESMSFLSLLIDHGSKGTYKGFDSVVVCIKMAPKVPWRVALLGGVAFLKYVIVTFCCLLIWT